MKTNIEIVGTGVTVPSKRMTNETYVENFKELGLQDIDKSLDLMESLGRDVRFIVDKEKDSYFGMAEKAVQDALTEAELSADAIDMVVFVTDTPEYTYPSNAVILHERAGLKNATYAFDINSNCTGMLTGIEVVSRFMQSNPRIQNALVVGAVYASSIIEETDIFTLPIFSDGASAVVLQKREAEESKGFIDGVFLTESTQSEAFRYPAVGFSKVNTEETTLAERTLKLQPVDASFFVEKWVGLVEDVLDANGLTKTDIGHCFFSQFSKSQAEETVKELGLSLDKTTYIGHQVGYTGVNSPIFALNKAIEDGKIEQGSYVIMASVGSGYNMSVLLFKY
ncbi:3-oxoacyl-ACP synthase III family protein [Rossellomorea marisflavi]|uniref:3-oxoacyl-ACP synthase III family protein n=1 Tax=Rossellomorea marisflavi TaxID=189381 RepID=UPI003FA08073